MVVIAMPAAVEPYIRIGVVNPVVRFVPNKLLFDVERRRFQADGRHDAARIDSCLKELFDDAALFVSDGRDRRMPL